MSTGGVEVLRGHVTFESKGMDRLRQDTQRLSQDVRRSGETYRTAKREATSFADETRNKLRDLFQRTERLRTRNQSVGQGYSQIRRQAGQAAAVIIGDFERARRIMKLNEESIRRTDAGLKQLQATARAARADLANVPVSVAAPVSPSRIVLPPAIGPRPQAPRTATQPFQPPPLINAGQIGSTIGTAAAAALGISLAQITQTLISKIRDFFVSEIRSAREFARRNEEVQREIGVLPEGLENVRRRNVISQQVSRLANSAFITAFAPGLRNLIQDEDTIQEQIRFQNRRFQRSGDIPQLQDIIGRSTLTGGQQQGITDFLAENQERVGDKLVAFARLLTSAGEGTTDYTEFMRVLAGLNRPLFEQFQELTENMEDVNRLIGAELPGTVGGAVIGAAARPFFGGVEGATGALRRGGLGDAISGGINRGRELFQRVQDRAIAQRLAIEQGDTFGATARRGVAGLLGGQRTEEQFREIVGAAVKLRGLKGDAAKAAEERAVALGNIFPNVSSQIVQQALADVDLLDPAAQERANDLLETIAENTKALEGFDTEAVRALIEAAKFGAVQPG